MGGTYQRDSNGVERLDELVRMFDFKGRIGGNSGSMFIQIDESRLRKYDFCELLLLPYLQRAFKRDDDLTVGVLRNRIRKPSVLNDCVWGGRGNPFYKNVLEKLDRDKLIQLTSPLDSETGILEGQNYFQARVRKIMRLYDSVAKNEANM